MCVAVPGKIVKIVGNTAKVDIMNNICDANISLITPKVGDYVLVHAGCVLEVLKKDMAEELIDIFKELEEVANGDSSANN